MKRSATMNIIIALMMLSIIAYPDIGDTAQRKSLEKSMIHFICHEGDIKVNTCAKYEELQDEYCVNGDVTFYGQLMLCNEVLETVNLGKLRRVNGELSIAGNSRLKFIVAPKFRGAEWISIENNPMFDTCRAEEFVYQTSNWESGELSIDGNDDDCYYEESFK